MVYQSYSSTLPTSRPPEYALAYPESTYTVQQPDETFSVVEHSSRSYTMQPAASGGRIDREVLRAARNRLRHVLRRVYFLDTRVRTGASTVAGAGVGALVGSFVMLPFAGGAVGMVVGFGLGRAISKEPFREATRHFFSRAPEALDFDEDALEEFVRNNQSLVRQSFGPWFWETLPPVRKRESLPTQSRTMPAITMQGQNQGQMWASGPAPPTREVYRPNAVAERSLVKAADVQPAYAFFPDAEILDEEDEFLRPQPYA
ncbi:hypothetical protein J8273_4987 [Carpediemonas membranifera]|uniref:Uncharacterized protein n=1 Tax=Carpediemonas membranifera TaxID=201153 RepID=A0A8J6DZE2_9EUKA|nr:hypothetical protein J8273_4987 [Carpediemonas membranifera]|eukprot:KAG9393504.1 hypothetical protein J8273_4987 [Carpediemonas membranifera]